MRKGERLLAYRKLLNACADALLIAVPVLDLRLILQ